MGVKGDGKMGENIEMERKVNRKKEKKGILKRRET